jgi:anthranilate phosphoribosyltransferase
MLLNTGLAEWHVPSVIKEIGRGKFGAKPMDRATAAKLYDAMLKREVSDLQLGAILLAMRIKETPEEIAGFLDACKPHFLPLPVSTPSGFAPVLIPSYNGARKKPNLTPLLALLLAREGTGIAAWCLQDAGRDQCEIFQQLEIGECKDAEQISACWQSGLPAWMALSTLSPAMAGLLNIRKELGCATPRIHW